MQRVKQVQRKHKESEIRKRSLLFIDGQKWSSFCRRVCCYHSFSFTELRRQNLRFNFLPTGSGAILLLHRCIRSLCLQSSVKYTSFTANLSGHIFPRRGLLGFFFKFGKLLSRNTFPFTPQKFFFRNCGRRRRHLLLNCAVVARNRWNLYSRLAFAFAFALPRLTRVNPCICICICIAHVVDKWCAPHQLRHRLYGQNLAEWLNRWLRRLRRKVGSVGS